MIGAAIIGSGNIGTDLMIKILRARGPLRLLALVGIDPDSEGLARARRLGIEAIDSGVDGLVEASVFGDVGIVFDATSAGAHRANARRIAEANPAVRMIDLTPAAIGPYHVPVLAGSEHVAARDVNMVTCGGQATIPIVAAISAVAPVAYAEIVASISSRSAGPGTRANIDEFTETTASAIRTLGGATASKAIIVLNPAEPPVLMRNTVFAITPDADRAAISASVTEMAQRVAGYVPGYRLKQAVQFDEMDAPVVIPGAGPVSGLRTTVFLEVEGAGHHLPPYAGNLDIMTAAALRTGEMLAAADTASVTEPGSGA